MAKDFEEIVEDRLWLEDKSLKEIYEELSAESQKDRQGRMDDIKSVLPTMEQEAFRRQRVSMKQSRSKGPRNKENDNALKDLNGKIEWLEDEMEIIDLFPGVQYVMKRISDARDKMLARTNGDIQANVDRAKKRLEEAQARVDEKDKNLKDAKAKHEEAKRQAEDTEKQAKEAQEKLNRMKELEESIADLSEKLIGFEKFPEITDAIDKKIKALEDEKAELGSEEDLSKMISDAEDAKKQEEETKKAIDGPKKELEVATNDRNEAKAQALEVEKIAKENKPLIDAIDRCNNPWEKIINGLSWEAIATMKDEEIDERIGMPKEKAPKDADKKQKTKGPVPPISPVAGHVPPTPPEPLTPPKPPEPPARRPDPDPIEDKQRLFGKFKNWISSIREARSIKKAEKAIVKSEGKAKVGLFERFKRLFKRKDTLTQEQMDRLLVNEEPEPIRIEPPELEQTEPIVEELAQEIEPELAQASRVVAIKPKAVDIETRRMFILSSKPTLEEIEKLGPEWVRLGTFEQSHVDEMLINAKRQRIISGKIKLAEIEEKGASWVQEGIISEKDLDNMMLSAQRKELKPAELKKVLEAREEAAKVANGAKAPTSQAGKAKIFRAEMATNVEPIKPIQENDNDIDTLETIKTTVGAVITEEGEHEEH